MCNFRGKMHVSSRRVCVHHADRANLPLSSTNRLNVLCKGIILQRKNQFMQRLHSYWLLKRQSRSGVPLVRRLHSNVQAQRNTEQVRTRCRASGLPGSVR